MTSEHDRHARSAAADARAPGSPSGRSSRCSSPAGSVTSRATRGARLLDEAADVASLHVEQHGGEQQAVLRRDHRGPARVLDVRDLARAGSAHRSARATSTCAERLRVGAVLRRVPHAHRESSPALDRRRQHASRRPRSRSPAGRRRRRCRSAPPPRDRRAMFRYWPLVTCSG